MTNNLFIWSINTRNLYIKLTRRSVAGEYQQLEQENMERLLTLSRDAHQNGIPIFMLYLLI